MALTSNNLELIKAVANNDLHTAKRAAIASLTEDRSKKNAPVIDAYRKRLASAPGTLSDMPSGIKTLLVGESPEAFDADRYFLRKSEAEIFEDIRRMKLVAEELADRKIPYRNATLIYGRSGTGKTEFGRYVAHKLNMPFFYVSFANAIDSLMGGTAKNIRKIFEFCSSIPCVLMLDELDCISMRRCGSGSKGVDGELERTTISVMQEFDRLPNHVTLIAATNRPDIIDEALLRRFSAKHEIKEMTRDELRQLAENFVHATGTEAYIKEEEIRRLSDTHITPGGIMPELIRIIGAAIYEEKKVQLCEKERKEETVSGIWKVRYVWEDTVVADSEEEAVAAARRSRSYGTVSRTQTEKYEAERR